MKIKGISVAQHGEILYTVLNVDETIAFDFMEFCRGESDVRSVAYYPEAGSVVVYFKDTATQDAIDFYWKALSDTIKESK